jgi:hypothetical protein
MKRLMIAVLLFVCAGEVRAQTQVFEFFGCGPFNSCHSATLTANGSGPVTLDVKLNGMFSLSPGGYNGYSIVGFVPSLLPFVGATGCVFDVDGPQNSCELNDHLTGSFAPGGPTGMLVTVYYGNPGTWVPGSPPFAIESAFLQLRVVPEPESFALMAVGLVGLWMVCRKRRLRHRLLNV